ncbi:MAG: hypothetical protein J6J83_06595 [Oscillospiraceae bacterium]|nr:hypothetical protein [Oscillospiraceae bacterium]
MAGGTKGYHQYRGRGRGSKVLLVVLLLLVLLGAVSFMVLQKYIVYNDDGSVKLELPFFQKDSDTPGTIPDDDINIQIDTPDPQPDPEPQPQPPVLQRLTAYHMPYGCLNSDPAYLLEGESAVVVSLKGADGALAYASGIDLPDGVRSGSADTLTHLRAITESDCYTIARFSCICDNAYAVANPAAAVQYSWGGLWLDNYSRYWLDPTQESTRQYLCAIAKECAELGFDELLLDHLRFPIEGDLSQTTVASIDRGAAIRTLVEEIREAAGISMAVSIILPASIGTDYSFEISGLPITVLTESFDRIYVPAYEDSYYWLTGVLPADFDRQTRLVLTTGYAIDGSFVIVN